MNSVAQQANADDPVNLCLYSFNRVLTDVDKDTGPYKWIV